MDDMNTFERQVANEVIGSVRPPRSVDAMEIVRTATTTSPRWRFQSMFNATKFVVAGVIVALFGSFLLSGSLTQQERRDLPAAALSDGSMAPAIFTGTIAEGGGYVGTTLVTDEGHTLESGSIFAGVIDVTDPRMSGEWLAKINTLKVDDELPELSTAIYEIRNEGGRWIGTTSGVLAHFCMQPCPDGAVADFPTSPTVVFHGVDGYEGLTAYVLLWIGSTASGNVGNDVTGVIISSDMPPVPDLPVAAEWAAAFTEP